MTATPGLTPFTPADRLASETRLRLHALQQALEAVPLPRLATWVDAAYLAEAFAAEPWLSWAVQKRVVRARIAHPDEAEVWSKRSPVYFLDVLRAELALARARVGSKALRPVEQALASLVAVLRVEPCVGRIPRVPRGAALLLAVEDLEALLVEAGLEVAAAGATAWRRDQLGAHLDARTWVDGVVDRAATDWLWVWVGDPTGLVDEVRAELVQAGERLAPRLIQAIEAAITALLATAGLPLDTTGAARRQARRDVLERLAEALYAAGHRPRTGELVLFLAGLDGRLDEVARGVRLPRSVRAPEGLAWVRRSDWRRLRRQLAPLLRTPDVGEAIAAFEALI